MKKFFLVMVALAMGLVLPLARKAKRFHCNDRSPVEAETSTTTQPETVIENPVIPIIHHHICQRFWLAAISAALF
jgi:hypothetical protein